MTLISICYLFLLLGWRDEERGLPGGARLALLLRLRLNASEGSRRRLYPRKFNSPSPSSSSRSSQQSCTMVNPRKAVVVGISGCSSSGKTTISRLLRDIFPNTFVLHEDDFYLPEIKWVPHFCRIRCPWEALVVVSSIFEPGYSLFALRNFMYKAWQWDWARDVEASFLYCLLQKSMLQRLTCYLLDCLRNMIFWTGIVQNRCLSLT